MNQRSMHEGTNSTHIGSIMSICVGVYSVALGSPFITLAVSLIQPRRTRARRLTTHRGILPDGSGTHARPASSAAGAHSGRTEG